MNEDTGDASMSSPSAGSLADEPGPGASQSPARAPVRSCGDCTACCMVLGVKPIEKPAFQACSHQGKGGCGIYATRPTPCRVYRCAWLDGMGQRKHRPDRLGVIVDQVAPANVAELEARAQAGDAGAVAEVERHRKSLRAREVRPGGLHGKRAKALLEGLTRAGLLVQLVPFGGRRLPVGGVL